MKLNKIKVSLEFVKIIQAFFIGKDDDMYTVESDHYCKVMTSTINEELGQVEYFFTDKTGTLTCNKMEFKLAVIGNEVYGDKNIDANQINLESMKIDRSLTFKKTGVHFNFQDKKIKSILRILKKNDIPSSLKELKENCILSSSDYFGKSAIIDKFPFDINAELNFGYFKNYKEIFIEYFNVLATCHECILEYKEEEKDFYYQV